MNRSLKILHVEAGRNLYGGALQVLYLLRGLKQRGCANVLVCPADSEIAAAADAAGRVYPVAMGGDLDIPFVFRLLRIIRREQPDLVHLHSRRGADLLGGVAARLAGLPTVLTRRVDNPESRRWVNIKYRLYDRVITISEAIRRVLIGEGVDPGKVRCIHSAVDTSRYTGECTREDFATMFNIPPDHRVCAVIAQFIERKGHGYLLRAIPKIVAAYPGVTFVFFGKGPLEQTLREQCNQLGIDAHVRFAGFRDDLADLFGCFDAVIHPADMEGLGVSLLQAAASGVPIVGTDIGAMVEGNLTVYRNVLSAAAGRAAP
jgi:glycosyltransferase involved in cell wall biosynthesis